MVGTSARPGPRRRPTAPDPHRGDPKPGADSDHDDGLPGELRHLVPLPWVDAIDADSRGHRCPWCRRQEQHRPNAVGRIGISCFLWRPPTVAAAWPARSGNSYRTPLTWDQAPGRARFLRGGSRCARTSPSAGPSRTTGCRIRTVMSGRWASSKGETRWCSISRVAASIPRSGASSPPGRRLPRLQAGLHRPGVDHRRRSAQPRRVP